MSDRRDTVLGSPPPPMNWEIINRLFTPGEMAARECVRVLYFSLIRKGAVDAQLAGDLCARAMAAVAEGGTAEEMLARWLPIHIMAEAVMDPDVWRAQPGPLLPSLTRLGGNAPLVTTWPTIGELKHATRLRLSPR